MRTAILVTIVAASSTSFAQALPVPNSPYRQGANHHIGDDSYVKLRGHEPGPRDPEEDRMHVHLSYMHDYLASRPATRPELAARRAEILGYLADYVAKNTTPMNEHVPWRTPVFIDDHGTICAVGYLIERTTGRALPEKIAAEHRYDYIDDIARAMPEVADWVASSGFTLEEIASIQPAYDAPEAESWLTWDLHKYRQPDGPYEHNGWRGAFRSGQMEGEWTVTDDKDHALGRGTMHAGAGKWTSYYADGKVLGQGRFARSAADGPWKLYFESGNLAAEGRFDDGTRVGKWSFYRDTPERAPIARGSFFDNRVEGTWRHYDDDGRLAAISRTETPDQWRAVDGDWSVDGGEGTLLEIVARPGEIGHAIHQGTVGSAWQRLDMYTFGGERMYIHHAYNHETMYDRDGFALVHDAAGWHASDCHWASMRRDIAREGDIVQLHGLLYQEARRRVHSSGHDMEGGDDDTSGPRCGAARAVSPVRAKLLDAILAARDKASSLSPAVVRAAVLANGPSEANLNSEADASPDGVAERQQAEADARDYAKVLADNMRMYVEWPHVDNRFVTLFQTMPGRTRVHWYDRGSDARSPQS
ncbi:MAG TPA: hypothetical protein VMJ10_23800 [Kofleriaceae bacterium]|nr:hypothetical protein [Kofleriaceae bacterium]